jgi:regulatory protein
MRLLGQREYAVGELHNRICAKWQAEENIRELADELVAELVSEGTLSDQRFVEAFVRSRQSRNQGPLKIRSELRQRQLPAELIEAALDQDIDFWAEIASAWLARKLNDKLNYDEKARYYRRLINRGFSHEQAMLALGRQINAQDSH